MTTRPARLPHDRSPNLTNTRPPMFTTQPPEILFFPVLSRDSTGEERFTVVRSPPCTLVGEDGVSVTTRLPSGRGREKHKRYQLHDPGPDPPNTFKRDDDLKSSPVTGSVRSGRLPIGGKKYPETDLARAISTRLPQRLKKGYNFFKSQNSTRRRFARYRHPRQYQEYLQGKAILANQAIPYDNTLIGETESAVLELARSYNGTANYPLVADDAPSTFFSMRTQDKKSRLQKGVKAAERDLSKTFGSVCHKAKSLFHRLTTRTELNAKGRPVRGTVRRRKGVSGIGSGDDEKEVASDVPGVGSWDDEKKVVSDLVIPSHVPRPSLFTRISKRIHPPTTGKRLVKKRPGDTFESRSSLDSLGDDPEKKDCSGKTKTPDRFVMNGQSRKSSLRRPIPASHSPPLLPPYTSSSQNPTVRSSAPPKLDIEIPGWEGWGALNVARDPEPVISGAQSEVSWDGSTQIGSSKAGSVSSIDGCGRLTSRDPPGSLVQKMNRRDTARSGGSDISGTTAASRRSGIESAYQKSPGSMHVGTSVYELKTRPSKDPERDTRFWACYVKGVDEKYQAPLGISRQTAVSSVPTLCDVVFPWEPQDSLTTQRGIMV